MQCPCGETLSVPGIHVSHWDLGSFVVLLQILAAFLGIHWKLSIYPQEKKKCLFICLLKYTLLATNHQSQLVYRFNDSFDKQRCPTLKCSFPTTDMKWCQREIQSGEDAKKVGQIFIELRGEEGLSDEQHVSTILGESRPMTCSLWRQDFEPQQSELAFSEEDTFWLSTRILKS